MMHSVQHCSAPADSEDLDANATGDAQIRDTFFARDLGPPVFSGTGFVRIGPMSHQQRMIALDTVVRGFIADPTIEYYRDQSVRYYIKPKSKLLVQELPHIADIRPYCSIRSNYDWLYLLAPFCAECFRPHIEHVRDKCLFEPTTWREYVFGGRS